jgi:hypothetical protein
MSMSPVMQPLHIFRKDAIHLWPETLISIALLAAFGWAQVHTWVPQEGFNPASLGVGFLVFLIPVMWLVLMSRLVHDEELVGDRQFWITRPYTWYSLLASKILYLLVFIGIPLIVMQMILLHHAGLYPMFVIPALLKNLCVVAVVFLLPLLAIAAVTATFIRYISSALAGVIYLFVVFLFAGYLWTDSLTAPYVLYIVLISLLIILVAALLLQYAKRKTLIARIMLLAMPLVFVVFALITPVNLLSSHRYPDVSAGKFTFVSNAVPSQEGKPFTFQHKYIMQIPVHVEIPGNPDETFIEGQRIRFTIDGPNGYHYTSDWTGDSLNLSAGQSNAVLPLPLPAAVFDKIHNQPVAVHLDLGTQTYHSGPAYTVTATEKPFPIPGRATCVVSPDSGVLECRFPFANPDVVQVTAVVHSGNCANPGFQQAQADALLPPSILPIRFSPVDITNISLRVGQQSVPLCPGTPATFRSAVAGDYGRIHLDIPAITLDAYALRMNPNAMRGQPQPQPQQ